MDKSSSREILNPNARLGQRTASRQEPVESNLDAGLSNLAAPDWEPPPNPDNIEWDGLSPAIPPPIVGLSKYAPFGMKTASFDESARGTVWRAGAVRVDFRNDLPVFSFGVESPAEITMTHPVSAQWRFGRKVLTMVLFWKEEDQE